MALIQCPACDHEISDRARSCPKCGHPLRPFALVFSRGFVLILAVVALFIFVPLFAQWSESAGSFTAMGVVAILLVAIVLAARAWKRKT